MQSKKIEFVFFEESWNEEKEKKTRPNRGRTVYTGGVKPTSPPENDTKESR